MGSPIRTKIEYARFYRANSPMFEVIKEPKVMMEAEEWKKAWEEKSKELGISLTTVTHECGHHYQYAIHGKKKFMLENYYNSMSTPTSMTKPVFTKTNCSVCYKIHHCLPELRPLVLKYISRFYKECVLSDSISEYTLAFHEQFYRFLYRDAYRYELWKLSNV